MNAVRVFAKLSDRSADYSGVPYAETMGDVNTALYTMGMYRRAYLAARFVWSKDLSVRHELTLSVMQQTLAIAQQEKWRVGQCKDRIKILVELAMIEHYAPSIFRSEKARYQFSKIPESKWYRTWGKRYEVAYGVINSYLDIAWGSIHK